jgi:hypothetical protein
MQTYLKVVIGGAITIGSGLIALVAWMASIEPSDAFTKWRHWWEVVESRLGPHAEWWLIGTVALLVTATILIGVFVGKRSREKRERREIALNNPGPIKETELPLIGRAGSLHFVDCEISDCGTGVLVEKNAPHRVTMERTKVIRNERGVVMEGDEGKGAE